MAVDLSTPKGRKDALERQKIAEEIKEQARDWVRTQKAEASRPRLGLVFDGEETLAPVEYVIEDLIPAEGAGMIFGETDLGKTTISVALGVHVAADKPWLGRAVRQGTVVFVESEGGQAFALRKHAAKGDAGLGDGGMFDTALPFVTIYEPLGFGVDTDVAAAIASAAHIRAAVQERGLPPVRFVVVDTLSQNMAGDANDNAEMQAFLRLFRAFLKALSASPVFGLLIHHPGHTEKGRGRGAYALEADLDLVMILDGTPETLTLKCKRQRNDRRFAPIPLRLEQRVITVNGDVLRDSRGREQTALVVRPRETTASDRPFPVRDAVTTAVLEALPDYPGKVGIDAVLVPKVSAILGNSVDKKTVRDRCYVLERQRLAESGPGRQKDSLAWGKAKPKPKDDDL
jgi:hypothetical protein